MDSGNSEIMHDSDLHTFFIISLPIISGIGGELRCELQDANGRPLPGFTLNQSIPMTRNSLRARVAWAGDTPLSSLEPTQPLRVRFVMEDTWLFSFQFV